MPWTLAVFIFIHQQAKKQKAFYSGPTVGRGMRLGSTREREGESGKTGEWGPDDVGPYLPRYRSC